jgi:hypothetical protein
MCVLRRLFLIIALLGLPSISIADVGPKTHTATLQRLQQGHWTTSANIRHKGSVETDVTLNNTSLIVENRFINRRKDKGFTGCVEIKVFGQNGQTLASERWQRGINGVGWDGRKVKVESGSIDIKDALAIGLKSVSVRQFRCSKERFVSGIFQLTKDATKGFRRSPGGVVGPSTSGLSDVGYSGFAIMNCAPKNRELILYYRHSNKSTPFIRYGPIPNHWRNGSCPGNFRADITMSTKTVYEVVFVLKGGSHCQTENPNLIGCQRYRAFYRGNPDAEYYVKVQVN